MYRSLSGETTIFFPEREYFPSEKMREPDQAIPVRKRIDEPSETDPLKLEEYHKQFVPIKIQVYNFTPLSSPPIPM